MREHKKLGEVHNYYVRAISISILSSSSCSIQFSDLQFDIRGLHYIYTGSVIAQQGYNFPRRQSTILLELSEMCTHLFNRRRSLLSYNFNIKSNVAEQFIVFEIFFIRGRRSSEKILIFLWKYFLNWIIFCMILKKFPRFFGSLHMTLKSQVKIAQVCINTIFIIFILISFETINETRRIKWTFGEVIFP